MLDILQFNYRSEYSRWIYYQKIELGADTKHFHLIRNLKTNKFPEILLCQNWHILAHNLTNTYSSDSIK